PGLGGLGQQEAGGRRRQAVQNPMRLHGRPLPCRSRVAWAPIGLVRGALLFLRQINLGSTVAQAHCGGVASAIYTRTIMTPAGALLERDGGRGKSAAVAEALT